MVEIKNLIYMLIMHVYQVFLWRREKKFVTFEKINSSKRGGVSIAFEGVVTIMTGVKCLGAQVGDLFFQK